MSFLRSADVDWFGKHRHRSLARSGMWAALQNGSQGILQLVSVVILSRLVNPEEFGLLAIAMVFYSVAAQLTGYGFSTAMVQKADLTNQQASNYFWVGTFLSGFAGLLIAGLGPILGRVYANPALVSLSILFGLLLWFDGMLSQHRALIQRAMRFDLIWVMQTASGLLGLAVAVFMATRGFGVWALAAQLAVGSIAMRLVMIFIVRWRPLTFKKGAGIRKMVHFGRQMSLGIFVNAIFNRSTSLILGNWGGLAEVGFFNRGEALFSRPYQQVAYPVASLLLPSMSAMQQESKILQHFTVQAMWVLTLLLLPLLVWIVNFGDYIAVFLLGNQWATAGTIMQWFAFAGVLVLIKRPLSAANAACGRPARAIVVKLVALPFFLVLVIWAAPKGAAMVAMMVVLTRILMFPFELHLLLKGLGFKVWRVNREIMMILFLGGISGLLLLLFSKFFPDFIGHEQSTFYMAASLFASLIISYLLTVAAAVLFPEARAVLVLLKQKTSRRTLQRKQPIRNGIKEISSGE